jgi:hypothetical protein
MVIVRTVFYAKYGRGDELVALLKQFNPPAEAGVRSRIMTDLHGRFFTIVQEFEVESITAWETESRKMFGEKDFQDIMARTVPLIESGYKEFWNVER